MTTTDVTELTRGATEARAAAEPAKATMVSQYATGFEGAAMAPFAPEAAAVLGAPVPELEVEIREDGIVYLPGVAYRRILSRAFGVGAWAILPRGPARTMGDLVVYHGALYVLGRFVSEAVGECQTRFGMSYASSLEGARTDCLTRCCKDLGVATELWDPTWRADWQAKYADKKWVEPKDGKKGRYSWSLKPKAGTFALVEGRNVGAPVAISQAAPTDGRGFASTAVVADPNMPPSANPVVLEQQPDTGEAPDEATIGAIRAAVKALGWKPSYAKIWLNGAFGFATPDLLTARQAADALEMLTVATACEATDDYSAYDKLRARLVAAGRVKTA